MAVRLSAGRIDTFGGFCESLMIIYISNVSKSGGSFLLRRKPQKLLFFKVKYRRPKQFCKHSTSSVSFYKRAMDCAKEEAVLGR